MVHPLSDIRICDICEKRIAAHKHHKFPNTGLNRRMYGALMDDPGNLQDVCAYCHIGEHRGLERFTEIDFCKAMNIIPRSKTGKLAWERLKAIPHY